MLDAGRCFEYAFGWVGECRLNHKILYESIIIIK